MPTDWSENRGVTPKRRLVLWLIILGLLGFIVVRLTAGDLSAKVGPGDFVEYWAAGRVLLQGGNPYRAEALLPLEKGAGWNREDALVPFQPPWSMLYVLPFAVLPFWFGRIAWFLVTVALLIWTTDWTWRFCQGSPVHRWAAWLCALLFMPAAISLRLGQISPLVLAGIVLFLVALGHDRGKLAGAATMLVAVKPHVVPLFWLFLALWVVRNRRWDVVFGAAVSFVLLLLGVLAINPSVYRSYLEVLSSRAGPMIWETPTWGVALRRLFPGEGNWLFLLPPFLGLAIGGGLWIRWRENFDFSRKLPAVLLLSSITAAYAWSFDWIVLLPVALLIVIRYLENTKANVAPFLCLVLFQVALALQGLMRASNFYTIWFPPALALLFCFASRSPASPAEPA